MHHSHAKHLTTVAVVLLILAAFLAGYQIKSGPGGSRPVYAALAPGLQPSPLDDSVSIKPVQFFSEALLRLQENFVDPAQLKNPDERHLFGHSRDVDSVERSLYALHGSERICRIQFGK